MRYQLFTREFVPKNSNSLIKLGAVLMLSFTPKCKRMLIREKLLKKITRYNNDPSLETVTIETMSTIQTPLPANLLDSYVMLQFEDTSFMCFAEWDEYLRRTCSNYMQYPPIEDRNWKHHPIIIDFEHNYDELSR
jgi:lipopolysaccharide cholinephosphotransferase